MQAEIPAEEPQVDAAHPQLCVPADLQPLPACRHQSLPSDVWGTVRHRSYCFCQSFEARWPSEQLQETQIKLLIHYLKDTFRLPSPVMNLARLSWCLIKNSRSLRLKGTLKSLPLIFFFPPDWGFSPRAWDRRGNRLQVGDLQQGFMINVCGEEEEERGQEGEVTVGSYVP